MFVDNGFMNFNPIRSEGVGAFKAPPSDFLLTHLILELHLCALGIFPKKYFNTMWQKNLIVFKI